jgi:hypothetical protein
LRRAMEFARASKLGYTVNLDWEGDSVWNERTFSLCSTLIFVCLILRRTFYCFIILLERIIRKNNLLKGFMQRFFLVAYWTPLVTWTGDGFICLWFSKRSLKCIGNGCFRPHFTNRGRKKLGNGFLKQKTQNVKTKQRLKSVAFHHLWLRFLSRCL